MKVFSPTLVDFSPQVFTRIWFKYKHKNANGDILGRDSPAADTNLRTPCRRSPGAWCPSMPGRDLRPHVVARCPLPFPRPNSHEECIKPCWNYAHSGGFHSLRPHPSRFVVALQSFWYPCCPPIDCSNRFSWSIWALFQPYNNSFGTVSIETNRSNNYDEFCVSEHSSPPNDGWLPDRQFSHEPNACIYPFPYRYTTTNIEKQRQITNDFKDLLEPRHWSVRRSEWQLIWQSKFKLIQTPKALFYPFVFNHFQFLLNSLETLSRLPLTCCLSRSNSSLFTNIPGAKFTITTQIHKKTLLFFIHFYLNYWIIV